MAGRTELAELRHSIDLLTAGLQAMSEAQNTHTEMIKQLLDAATAPTDPEHQTARLLKGIVDKLTRQTTQLTAIRGALDNIPAAVGASVAKALAIGK